MQKAPANLFGEDKSQKRRSEGSDRPSKPRKDAAQEKSEKESKALWFSVHEINDMAKSAKVRARSMPRLRQEELKALGAEGPKKGATPMKIGRAMSIKKRELNQKLRLRDRDVGMLTAKKKTEHPGSKLDKDDYLRKLKGNRSGLSKGNRIHTDALVGKFQGGVLKISQSDIDSVRANRKR